MNWTETNVASLQKMWADGQSFSQIANAMGATRSGIAGKLRRLNTLKRDPKLLTSKQRGDGSSESTRKRRHRKVRGATLWGRNAPVELPPEVMDDIPPEQRKTLLELMDPHCRFGFGDPQKSDFYFCGAQRWHKHTAFCQRHHRIAYRRASA